MKRSIYCSLLMSAMISVVAAEETEKILMRTSQDEDQKDVI